MEPHGAATASTPPILEPQCSMKTPHLEDLLEAQQGKLRSLIRFNKRYFCVVVTI